MLTVLEDTKNPLHAVQHIRRMRGGSQAHLMAASDRNYYIVKFQNNPQHRRILANEFLASRLGRMLGLAMPEVRVIDVSEWLIQHTPELRMQPNVGWTVPCQTGQNLAIRYAVDDPFTHNIFDYVPEALACRIFNLRDFARMLVLDKWACNTDGRQAIFSRRANYRYYHVTFIDHGYYFNAGQWTFPDAPLHGIYYSKFVYQHVTGWKDFEPVLSRAEETDRDELWHLTEGLPEEWWYLSHPSELHRLIEILDRRREMIRNLITSFRDSDRKPFPNWGGQANDFSPQMPEQDQQSCA